MDWDDVRHFLALARTGSVRAAGASLGGLAFLDGPSDDVVAALAQAGDRCAAEPGRGDEAVRQPASPR